MNVIANGKELTFYYLLQEQLLADEPSNEPAWGNWMCRGQWDLWFHRQVDKAQHSALCERIVGMLIDRNFSSEALNILVMPGASGVTGLFFVDEDGNLVPS
jgi:hypothetical protein